MKIFKVYKYDWWQIGVFKFTLLCIGIAMGAYWHSFFGRYLIPLVILAALGSIYIWYISCKQIK